jgi:SAM-dependent methyltransferase
MPIRLGAAEGEPLEICGDGRMSLADRFRYLWRNSLRNLMAGFRGPRTRAFTPEPDECMKLFKGQSPSRLITDQFFASLPEKVPTGRKVIVDIGCGTGEMADALESAGYCGRYVGIDIADKFSRHKSPTGRLIREFVQIDAHSYIADDAPDIITSFSTLEHIPHDRKLLVSLNGMLTTNGVQVHAVPAGAALFAYLWHGYRQYNAIDLAHRFKHGKSEFYRIGGLGSLIVHVLLVSPEIFVKQFIRQRLPKFYEVAVRLGLHLDRIAPVLPTSYVVLSWRSDASP